MIGIIGIFILLLGIVFDDITTLVLMTKGYGALETNPLYVQFGLYGWLISSIIIYLFMISSWLISLNNYNKAYKERTIGYKIFDVFILIFCIFLVFFSATKIELGVNNLERISKHVFKTPQNKEFVEKDITYIKQNVEYKKVYPNEYKQQARKVYFNNITNGISYLNMWLSIILGYLLFRVAYKVVPYEYA